MYVIKGQNKVKQVLLSISDLASSAAPSRRPGSSASTSDQPTQAEKCEFVQDPTSTSHLALLNIHLHDLYSKMSNSKSVPLSPVSMMRDNNEDDVVPGSSPYSQPSAIDSQSPENHPPWWAESDYLPPSIQKFVEANAGLSLVCASQLCFVLMNVTVKYFISSTEISIPSLILVRQGMTALGCIVSLYYLQDPNPLLGPPEIRRMLCARGFFGTGGLISTYESFQGLSVSDTTAIQFLTPTCLLIFGFLVLKERPTRRELIAGMLCLGGVMLVSRPPFLFGHLAEDDGIEAPPGRVNLPGQPVEEPHHTSRAVGVAWAFVSVLCSSTACTYFTSQTCESVLTIQTSLFEQLANALMRYTRWSTLPTSVASSLSRKSRTSLYE